MADFPAMGTRILAQGPCTLGGVVVKGEDCPEPWTLSLYVESESSRSYVVKDCTMAAGDSLYLPFKAELSFGQRLALDTSNDSVDPRVAVS